MLEANNVSWLWIVSSREFYRSCWCCESHTVGSIIGFISVNQYRNFDNFLQFAFPSDRAYFLHYFSFGVPIFLWEKNEFVVIKAHETAPYAWDSHWTFQIRKDWQDLGGWCPPLQRQSHSERTVPGGLYPCIPHMGPGKCIYNPFLSAIQLCTKEKGIAMKGVLDMNKMVSTYLTVRTVQHRLP